MSVEVERATLPCGVCGAAVSELRRGRFEKRRDQLRLVELHGRSLPLCHGCASRIGRLDEVPPSVELLRKALKRNRRDGERREGSLDHRVFPRERRVGERRNPPRDAGFADTDPHVAAAAAELDEVVLEITDDEIEQVEQTFVRAAPAPAKNEE
jgi:hypothetical protein